MGAITSIVPAITAAPNKHRRRHPARANTSNTAAQPAHKYNGFTRNQHAIPSNTPAPSANHTLPRSAANNSNQQPPSTNHIAGASAEGYAPYIANSGETANRKLAAIAARQPKAVHAIPVISTNARIESVSHCTFCTTYTERWLLNL